MRVISVIVIAAVTSFIVSVICCNISAIVTLNIIDRHVKEMIRLAKESIRDAYVNK